MSYNSTSYSSKEAAKNATRRKIIISERDNIAALMEGDKAIEFIINRGEMLLGDVYLAQVENILPSIDAGFVNVGGDKMGFLHSSDVQGRGDLKSRLKPRQRLIVQVMKEPTGHKGPRVTTNISLPGRFLVLMPGSRGVSVSRKIETQQERSRLKSICSMVKANGIGVIVRTEAAGQTDSDIIEDFEVLLERWQNIVTMADSAEPPVLLYRDQDLIYRVVRELVTEQVDELIVDTAFGSQRAQQLLQNWNLDKTINVQHYTGQQSIMVAKGVEREIRQALQTKVPLPSGGYLYIQPTEALCVVDVNSGRFTSLSSQAETIRITNLESCREIARQLRLRNIGGMIICDFIDMESRADQLAILQTFENELAPDKAKPQVGQLTDLGLVEMTRHRQGQALSEIFQEAIAKSVDGNITFEWVSTSAEIPDYRQAGKRLPRSSNRSNKPEREKDNRDRDKDRNSNTSSSPKEKPQLTPRKEKPASDAKPAMEETKSSKSDAPKSDAKRQDARRTKRDEKPPLQAGDVLYKQSPAERANITYDYAELMAEKSLATMNAQFAHVVTLAFPPRGVHQTLMRYNAKSTSFMTLLNSFLQRDADRAERRSLETDEDVLIDEESEPLGDDTDLEVETVEEDDTVEGVAPIILTPPVGQAETLDAKTESVLEAVDAIAKPVMLAKLAEQLQQNQTPQTGQQTRDEAEARLSMPSASAEADHLIQEVVLPFVDALRNAEDSEAKKQASQRFLLDVSRMTPAEKLLSEGVSESISAASFEQLGIPEVPLPFEFEGEQDLINQLVEVAETIAEVPHVSAQVSETPDASITVGVDALDTLEPTVEASEEAEADDNEDIHETEGGLSAENLDEIIKRKRHALNKQSGTKSKKRTTQNHKKKKK